MVETSAIVSSKLTVPVVLVVVSTKYEESFYGVHSSFKPSVSSSYYSLFCLNKFTYFTNNNLHFLG